MNASTPDLLDALGSTLVLVHDAQSAAPFSWDRLDEHLRSWLDERARAADLPHGTTAEDLVQEVMLTAFRDIASFEVGPDASFRGWLMVLIERRRNDFWRRYLTARRGGGCEARLDTELGARLTEERGFGQQTACALAEERQDLMDAIAELSPKHRAVLELFGLQERTAQEVAELLGYQRESTVRVLHLRARRALRKRIVEARGRRASAG